MQDGPPPAEAREKNQELARAHPLTMFGVDALVSACARLRPDTTALHDHGESGDEEVRFTELDAAARVFAARLREFGLTAGARIILCCPPRGYSLIAITAIVAAGFEPVLAPLQASHAALIKAASAVDAEALIAPASFAQLDFEDKLLTVAANAPSIRFLGSLTPNPFDGAADFSLSALSGGSKPPTPENWGLGDRLSIGVADKQGATVFLSQSALQGHSLDLVRKTRRGGAAPIVSLVSPGSFGGLIAGPLAALLSGAELHFLAPFKAAVFLRLLDSIGPVRLVAPAAILPDLRRSGLLDNGAVLSCSAIGELGETKIAHALPVSCPIITISTKGAAVTISMASQTNLATSVA